jgi:hypothetical protein
MKKIVSVSLLVSMAVFSGCTTNQSNVTYKSDVIKQLANDENPVVDGTTLYVEKIDNSPLLTKPKIAKITINPYIDSDGDYHEKKVIHTKIVDSKLIENKKYFSINKE